MEYIMVAFRSRSDTVRFAEYLRSVSVPAEIVNTPKEAGVGCGLSVQTPMQKFAIVKRAVFLLKLGSFAGFFTVKTIGGKKFVKSI